MPLCFTEMIAFCCLKRWVTVFNKYWNTACLKNTHSHLLKQIARSSKRKASMPTNDALSCIGHGLLQKMPWLRSYLLQGVLSWDSCYIFLCMGSQNANVSPFRKGIPYLLWKVCRKNKMEYSPENSHFTKKIKIQIGFHVGSPMLKFMSGIRCHVGAGEFEHFWTLFGHFSYRHRTQQAAIEGSSKTSMLAIIAFQWRLTQRFQWIWGS